MANALDVARYLIHVATPTDDEGGDCLGPMRLQKLLYYVQGWHLAAIGLPCFHDRIEAWPHGPVVKSIYPKFKPFGKAIPSTEGEETDSLDERTKEFVRSIWDIYKGYSTTALRDMSHLEKPWVVARGGLPPDDPSSAEITSIAMREFFFPRYVELLKRKDSRINIKAWQASASAVVAGHVRTAKDIRRELRDRHTQTDRG